MIFKLIVSKCFNFTLVLVGILIDTYLQIMNYILW